jgi:hypothetical protein
VVNALLLWFLAGAATRHLAAKAGDRKFCS